jgi:hypothetical protein
MTTRFCRINRWALVVLALSAMTVGHPAGRACDPKKPPKKVRVSVLVILASEKDDRIDKKLTCIAREVRKSYPELKGFRMGTLGCKSLTVGIADKFDLVEEQKACVTVQRAADKMERVRVKVGPPSMGQITYSTPCGKFLPILTPFRTKTGEVVLIAIRVQPCGGK